MKKIERSEEIVLEIRRRRADLIFDLFEEDKTFHPDVIFRIVMEIRSLTKILKLIEKNSNEKTKT